MRYLFISIYLLLLAACSQLGTQKPLQAPQQSELPPPDDWKITAKLGMKVPQQSGSVSLIWQQKEERYRIHVRAPLGQGSALIYGDDQQIVIERPGKPLLISDNASALIEETFGWRFPIHDLKFWVRGIPNPYTAITTEQQSQTGILETLEQSEWQLQYSRHQQVAQWYFPGKIVARQGDTRLTMIIRKWELL